MELCFKEQANTIDKGKKEIGILVYKQKENCPLTWTIKQHLSIIYHHLSLSKMLNDIFPSEIEYLQNAANDAWALFPEPIAISNSGHLGMPLGFSKIGASSFVIEVKSTEIYMDRKG